MNFEGAVIALVAVGIVILLALVIPACA